MIIVSVLVEIAAIFTATSITPSGHSSVVLICGYVCRAVLVLLAVVGVCDDHCFVRVEGVHVQEIPREERHSPIQSHQLHALANPFTPTVSGTSRFACSVPASSIKAALHTGTQAIPASSLRSLSAESEKGLA